MRTRIQKLLYKLVALDPCPYRLTRSFCLGAFVALSPFIGLHTLLIFIFCWLFKLNVAVAFVTATAISNPLTIIPIKTAEYLLGYFITYDLLGIDLLPYNPWWMDWLNRKIDYLLPQHDICLWYFLIGGNLVALVITAIAYPVMLAIFKRLSKRLYMPDLA